MLLQARQIYFTIEKTPILSDINLGLRAGEFVGLIGANGAGKTTLLKVISGLWPGAMGEIDLLGRPLRSYNTREIARIVAHVPQSIHVDFAFSAREVVLMGRSPHLRHFEMESAHDRAIAEHAMHITQTSHLAHRLIHTLSGGEQQRVVIARALTQEPRILLLDEPTSNLDIKHQMNVLSMVQSLAQESQLGVIAAIHDLGLAARFCTRLVMMARGRIAADGTPEEVLTAERLAQVFEIDARIYRDPFSGHLAVSVQG
jgi:iron complex transport system ATP-binding protein